MCFSGPRVSLLVTDVDNTLFDWLGMWHPAFSAMLQKVSQISGVPEAVLEAEVRVIHLANHTVEYGHLLENMPSLRMNGLTSADVRQKYDHAIELYRHKVDERLYPYPRVIETLRRIRGTGCQIVAYTESLQYQTTFRFRQLGFDGLIQVLYSPGDLPLPDDRPDLIERRRQSEASLTETQLRRTPPGEVKPNPAVLLDIVHEAGGNPSTTAYVGDNLRKDVWMAQQAGVLDVHASYGGVQTRPEYGLLQRVSHWPDTQVSDDRATTTREIHPRFVLEDCFDELLRMFEFVEAGQR